MSKIPFHFDITPSFFRKNGWFKCDNTLKFVTWCFSRCCSTEKEIMHDNQIHKLKPFQFIFGRYKCSEDTNMSEREVRTQQKLMENSGLLKKSPNKTPNRFTIYEWVTDRFSENNDQVKDQQTTNRRPTDDHKQEEQILDTKENNVECERCFYDCLEKDNRLDPEHKEFLMKFTEERVILALAYSKEIKATKTLIAQLIWHCSLKKPPTTAKKKDFKKEMRKLFKHGQVYNGASCWHLEDEIAFERGMKHKKISDKQANYEEEFNKILDSFGIIKP